MTQNQIAYYNAQENERHNRAAEAETARHQMKSEEIEEARNSLQAMSIAETQRANLARETETQRSNMANEAINSMRAETDRLSMYESQRHSLVTEDIASRDLASQILLRSSQMGLNDASAFRNYADAYLSQARIPEAQANVNLMNQTSLLRQAERGLKVEQIASESADRKLTHAQVLESASRSALNLANAGLTKSQEWVNYSQVGKNILGVASDIGFGIAALVK